MYDLSYKASMTTALELELSNGHKLLLRHRPNFYAIRRILNNT